MTRSTVSMWVVLVCSSAKCQTWPDHRWDHWVFGENNAWLFENGECHTLPGIPNSFDGIPRISVSDPVSGDLLFYGNASGLLDRNGDPMPTCACPSGGESGEPSVIKLPGSDSMYWVLYTVYDDAIAPLVYTLRYAVVDMSLNNGYGDVASYDHIIAEGVHHHGWLPSSTGDTLWLLAQISDANAGNWYSYPVTTQGLGPQQWTAPDLPWTGGTMEDKADRSGTRFIGGVAGSSQCQLFHFDASTGELVDPLYLWLPHMRSVEFSSDGTKLYVLTSSVSSGRGIDQYRLDDWNADSIIASRTVILEPDGWGLIGSDIDLGPDGRIYVSGGAGDSTSVGVINEPNLAGTACDYEPYSVPLCSGATVATATRFPNCNWPKALGNVSVPEHAPIPSGLGVWPIPGEDCVHIAPPPSMMGQGPLRIIWLASDGSIAQEFTAPYQADITMDREHLPAGVFQIMVTDRTGRSCSGRALLR